MSDPVRRLAERRALHALDRIYRTVKDRQQGWGCARSGECCQLARTGREPYAWPLEWIRVREALARAKRSIPGPREDGACALLDANGGCSVYEDRPLGCRTFFCERGAGPTRITRAQITASMVALERVAQTLDPEVSAPRPLVEWLRGAGGDPT